MRPPSPTPSSIIEILLVEDNPHDAELTLRGLRQHHLANRIVWVKDGAAALNALFGPTPSPSSNPHCIPRLILLDLKLPKVDGHEVLQRLKSNPHTRTIPVVILTSSREEADLLRAYEAGTNSYIVKPVDFDKFTEAVFQLGLYWLLLNQAPATRCPGDPPPHD